MCEMGHDDLPDLAIAQVVRGGGLCAGADEDAVGVVEKRQVLVGVVGTGTSVGGRFGEARCCMSDLAFAQEGELDVDYFVAPFGDEVRDNLIEDSLDLRICHDVNPLAADTQHFFCVWRGGLGRGEEVLPWVIGIGLGHKPVGDGQVGDGAGHRADHADGGGHGDSAVVGWLQAVNATEGGWDAYAPSYGYEAVRIVRWNEGSRGLTYQHRCRRR